MSVGEEEAVAVEPGRGIGGIAHGVLPQCDSDGGHAYGGSRMAHAELLAQICDEEAEGLEDEGHVFSTRLRRRRGFSFF